MNSFKTNLSRLFPIMAAALHPAKYPDNKTPKGRYNLNGSGATRPGYKHKIGAHFHPRQITQVKVKNYDSGGIRVINPTPALYRRLHLGDRKKMEALNGS